MALGLGGTIPVDDVMALARRAEEEGFEALWLHETMWQRDGGIPLAAAATATRRLRLGAGCLSPYLRHPALLAQTAATLQELSDGRLILAVGTGFPRRLDMMGVAHPSPAAAIREGIELIRRLWSGETVAYRGRVFSVEGVRLEWGGPMPPAPPVYVAGWRPRMLEVAATHADGYLARPMEPPVMVRRRLDAVRRAASRHGRSLDGFETAGYVLCAIGDDEKGCFEALRHDPFVVYQVAVLDDDVAEAIGIEPDRLRAIREAYWAGDLGRAAGLISRAILEQLAVFGPPAAAAEQLARWHEAGMTVPVLQPVRLVPEWVEGIWRTGRLVSGVPAGRTR